MAVIKTGAAEHNVYISIMPTGLSGFMKGPASRSAQSAQFTEAEPRYEAGGSVFFHLPAVSSQVRFIAVTDIRFWGGAVLMCRYDQTVVEVS